MRNGLLSSAFEAFVENRETMKQLRAIGAKMQLRHVLAAFNAWREYAYKMERAEQLLLRIVASSL